MTQNVSRQSVKKAWSTSFFTELGLWRHDAIEEIILRCLLKAKMLFFLSVNWLWKEEWGWQTRGNPRVTMLKRCFYWTSISFHYTCDLSLLSPESEEQPKIRSLVTQNLSIFKLKLDTWKKGLDCSTYKVDTVTSKCLGNCSGPQPRNKVQTSLGLWYLISKIQTQTLYFMGGHCAVRSSKKGGGGSDITTSQKDPFNWLMARVSGLPLWKQAELHNLAFLWRIITPFWERALLCLLFPHRGSLLLTHEVAVMS